MFVVWVLLFVSQVFFVVVVTAVAGALHKKCASAKLNIIFACVCVKLAAAAAHTLAFIFIVLEHMYATLNT